jgi:hypothetical protein
MELMLVCDKDVCFLVIRKRFLLAHPRRPRIGDSGYCSRRMLEAPLKQKLSRDSAINDF